MSRVLVQYVCAKKQHVLGAIEASTAGYVLVPRKVPVSEGTSDRVRQRAYPADERMPVKGEPFWSTVLACGDCRCEYALTQAQTERDTEDAIRRASMKPARVVLDAIG